MEFLTTFWREEKFPPYQEFYKIILVLPHSQLENYLQRTQETASLRHSANIMIIMHLSLDQGSPMRRRVYRLLEVCKCCLKVDDIQFLTSWILKKSFLKNHEDGVMDDQLFVDNIPGKLSDLLILVDQEEINETKFFHTLWERNESVLAEGLQQLTKSMRHGDMGNEMILNRVQALLRMIHQLVQRGFSPTESKDDVPKNINESLWSLLEISHMPYDLMVNASLALTVILSLNGISISDIVDSWNNWHGKLDGHLSRLSLSAVMAFLFAVISSFHHFPTTDSSILQGSLRVIVHLHAKVEETSNVESLAFYRLLNQWCSALLASDAFPVTEREVRDVLLIVWSGLDHYMATVRHTTLEAFSSLLKAISKSCHSEDADLMQRVILKEVEGMSKGRKVRYRALDPIVRVFGFRKILEQWPELPSVLVGLLLDDPMLGPVAVGVYKELYQQGSSSCKEALLIPIFEVLKDTGGKRRISEHIDVLLKALTAIDPGILDHFHGRDLVADGYLRAVLCCTSESVIISPSNLEAAFESSDCQIQLLALSALASNRKLSLPLTAKELDSVVMFLQKNMAHHSPAFHQQVTAHIKKVLLRLSCSWDSSEPKVYDEFLQSLYGLCLEFLFPCGNFPHRIMALEILHLIHEHLRDHISFATSASTSWYGFIAFLCLRDTYEENKIIASSLLMDYPPTSLPLLCTEGHWQRLVGVGRTMAGSPRPPDSQTAAFLLSFLVKKAAANPSFYFQSESMCDVRSWLIDELVKDLEKQINVAQENLLAAAASGPMYGTLLCLHRLMLDVLTEQEPTYLKNQDVGRRRISQMVKLCFDATDIVMPVVANSSPEGHLPMDSSLPSEMEGPLSGAVSQSIRAKGGLMVEIPSDGDGASKAVAVTSQMLLLCGWRTVKEAALLLGSLSSLLPSDALLNVGHRLAHWLSVIKHRGAFEQTYAGFLCVSTHLWREEDKESGRLIPDLWLEDAIENLSTGAKEEGSATRRSAGFPFFMQAMLVTEPKVRNHESFRRTMKLLIGMAQAGDSSSPEKRIHAFNILRALYRDSRLSELVLPYVDGGIKASIAGFKSQVWGERNSASLLLSALIQRTFGVKRGRIEGSEKNRMTGQTFFTRFPELKPFLLNELALAVSSPPPTVHLHPLLLILSRLHPSALNSSHPQESLEMFEPLLIECGGNCIEKIRVLAGRALDAILTPPRRPHVLLSILHALKECQNSTSNKIHGLLLMARQILLSMIKEEFPHLPDLEEHLVNLANLASGDNPCHLISATALDILCLFSLMGNSVATNCNLRMVTSSLLADSNEPGFVSFQVSLLNHHLLQKTSASMELLNELVKCPNPDVIVSLCDFFLKTDSKEDWQLTVTAGSILQEEHILRLICSQECTFVTDKDNLMDTLTHMLSFSDHLYAREAILLAICHILEQDSDLCVSETLLSLATTISMILEDENREEACVAAYRALTATMFALSHHASCELWDHFFDLTLRLAEPERFNGVRLRVAYALHMIAIHRLDLVKAEIRWWRTAFLLHRDDEEMIREKVEEVRGQLLHSSRASPGSHSWPALFIQICERKPESVAFLVQNILWDASSAVSFELDEEQDCMFDKGEMSTYAEELPWVRACSAALQELIAREKIMVDGVQIDEDIFPLWLSGSSSERTQSVCDIQHLLTSYVSSKCKDLLEHLPEMPFLRHLEFNVSLIRVYISLSYPESHASSTSPHPLLCSLESNMYEKILITSPGPDCA
ncbi:unnamed protein product [Darwinula stevensoni]|uniref:tRNA (32-2'-O)-methyltransferase regulator THADA n=1 Tax=Darwinula stevensoni TaxID=69355 RepID=A0A7R8XI79_9CRUS|nr:unnamed protein product [Darwinula stevensoni]CAG0894093.1 unnamed protein product [Darwinula stevensoni]